MLLTALEKHIPSARLLLEEAIPDANASSVWGQADPEQCEFLCVYGVSGALYAYARPWLDEDPIRRLVFIEERGGALSRLLEEDDAILLLNDRRVKLYFLETPFQIEPMAKKVAWQAVFRKLSILLLQESETAVQFQEILKQAHLAAHLLLSDASDWGSSVLKNAKANRRSLFRRGLELAGKFKNIPAVIVGAGPSLEKNGPLLRSLENKALIFAGGTALNALEGEPHFAASIDKEAPYRQFKIHPYSQTPFLYQSRMNPENFSLVHAEALLFPDGNSPAVNWIQREEKEFDGGWTVGNFLTAVALLMGCNPVIFVGMDLCYRKGKKYAQIDAALPEGLVSAHNQQGEAVWTQRDWLMAARWTEEQADRRPETLFIDATEGGLGFRAPVLSDTLQNAIQTHLAQEWDLRGRVHAAVQALPVQTGDRWEEWEASLRRCEKECAEIAAFQIEQLEEEIAYQKLLLPLWSVWKPVFERELDLDPQPLSLEQKLKLNQVLFFQQVLQEHLHG